MAVPQGLRTGRARRALIDMEEGMRLVEKFIVPKATGKGFIVKKGQLLRISNPEGPQVVDFDAFNADNPKEYLSSSVTRREEGIHVTTGSKLYAGPPLERHMFTIVADTVDHKPCPSGARSHDFVMGRCSQVRRRQRYGKDTPGCQEILAAAIKPFQHIHENGRTQRRHDVLGAFGRGQRRLHRSRARNELHRGHLGVPRRIERPGRVSGRSRNL
jgi:uncharacterized protein YcgI (DUF1989 family)